MSDNPSFALVRDSDGTYRACMPNVTEDEIISAAMEILSFRFERGSTISGVADCKRYFLFHLGTREREVFSVVFLDNRHRLLSVEDLFLGTIDGATVHPRIVVQRALALNAAAVILCHNHPSGVCEPSQADRQITERLREALSLVDIRVLDHLVIGNSESICSFAERGLM